MSDRATILYFPHGGGPLPLLGDAAHQNMASFLRAYPRSLDRPAAIVVVNIWML